MQALLVLGFAAVFGALWIWGHQYKPGEGPLDRLPPGVPRKPSGSRVESSSDGTKYLVHYWPPAADNRQFHVAERKGERAWISFWFDRGTGKRSLWASLAHSGELDDMRKDWGI